MTQEALKLALECAERCEEIDGMYSWIATITAIKEALAQPQRTWVGLTDEDICMFSMWLDDKSDVAIFTAIEAKLKEKNT